MMKYRLLFRSLPLILFVLVLSVSVGLFHRHRIRRESMNTGEYGTFETTESTKGVRNRFQ